MLKFNDSEDNDTQCPVCQSKALYKYGKITSGKQRYLCMICGRQFALGVKRIEIKDRPVCPKCGRPMHLYRREGGIIRFRCSCYPDCKTYAKVGKNKETINEP
jgi:DNA-directed RNA polymerase subunit RPC12/RpoP